MNKIKFLKRYTYTSILDVNFNVLIYFDYDSEVLLYSLEVEDNNYNSIEYLVECATSLRDDKINNIIRSFMLDYIANNLRCYAKGNGYKEWNVEVYKNGIKLINIVTKQHVEWWLYDYDEDYEVIQNKVINFITSLPKD